MYISRSTLHKIYIKLAIAGLAIVVALLGGFYYLKHSTTKSLVTANKLSDSGNHDGALNALKSAEKTTFDPAQKAAINLQLAQVALNDGKIDDCIKYARDVNAFKENDQAYALIGYAAQKKSNWQLAADSFARAASLVPNPNDPGENSPYNDYKILEKEARSHL